MNTPSAWKSLLSTHLPASILQLMGGRVWQRYGICKHLGKGQVSSHNLPVKRTQALWYIFFLPFEKALVLLYILTLFETEVTMRHLPSSKARPWLILTQPLWEQNSSRPPAPPPSRYSLIWRILPPWLFHVTLHREATSRQTCNSHGCLVASQHGESQKFFSKLMWLQLTHRARDFKMKKITSRW